MKRYCALTSVVLLLAFSITGCVQVESAPEENNLDVINTLNGSTLTKTHEIEEFEFITTYNTGDYDLSRWRITDSKVISMTAEVANVPEGATVLIEHVHLDMSLKSTDPQFDGLSQDYMDDSYHGTSQDGFFISDKYQYQNKFAVEGFSKDLIDGWSFIFSSVGSGSVNQQRLTEKNLVQYGKVYANKMQVVYDVLVKYADEDFYHVVSVLDEFLIPVEYEIDKIDIAP